jgi:hypothetical protein
MPEKHPEAPRQSFLGDIGVVWARRKELWKLRPADKLGFGSAVVITCAASYIQIQIAVLLGDFFDRVLKLGNQPAALTNFVTKRSPFWRSITFLRNRSNCSGAGS